MTLDPRLTHAALRTRLAKVRADALDRDYERMRWELDLFVDALTEHLLVESPVLDALPDAAGSIARDGQTRILSTLTALRRSARPGAQCGDCARLAAELDELVDVQDGVERQALRNHGLQDTSTVNVPVRVATAANA